MKKLFFLYLIFLSFSSLFCNSDLGIDSCDSLLYAAQEGEVDEVLALLKSRVNVNCLSKIDNTPLSMACAGGHLEVVKILLDYRANVNIANCSGVTPLYRASSQGYKEIIRELLKVKNINVNISDNEGITALFCASAQDNLAIVQELLKREDINVNSLTSWGLSPLDVTSDQEIKELLIQKGALKFEPVMERLENFIDAVNEGNHEKLNSVVLPEKYDLKKKISSTVKNGFYYKFNPNPLSKNVEFIDSNTIKIAGVFIAQDLD